MRDELPNRRQAYRRRTASVLLASALAVGAVGGCSMGRHAADAAAAGTVRPSALPSVPVTALVTPHCEVENVNDWTPVPPDIDRGAVAAKLGVTAARVDAGAAVQANCPDGIPTEAVNAGIVVTLDDVPLRLPFGPRCLIIQSNVLAITGAIARHVGGVCPLDPSITPRPS